jgi:hypothetical protein
VKTIPFTIPPATAVAGQPGFITDIDNLYAAVDTLAGVNVLDTTYSGGADPTGAADSQPAFAAAVGALPGSGGVVRIPYGTYKLASTVTITGTGVTLLFDPGTVINYTGSGDCLRVYNTDTTGIYTGNNILGLPIIDGTGAAAGACGLHLGDQRADRIEVRVRNFSGAGSIGIHLDNQNAWTEECFGYFWLSNNTQNLVFDVSGATTSTNSFGYNNFDVLLLAKQNQDGIVFQNGALYYNSRLAVKGNFQGTSGANTSAALRITGTVPAGHPGAGNGSKIAQSRLDVTVECTSATGSNAPQTIVFGTLGTNTLLGCTGVLDFSMGSLAFATSNWTATGGTGSFIFSGSIAGDFNLNNATVGTGGSRSVSTQGAISYGKSLLNVANGNTTPNAGDFFSSTLTGNITINLNPGGAACLGAAQRKTIIIKQAASGGPFTVTWPHTGSPTTSAPTVNWAGGTAPTMTATASAVDVYKLETYDGATWYGQAIQNVS